MKTKRQPTEAQKQASAERRERFTKLAQQVSLLTDAQKAELIAKVGTIITCEGRPLSHGNACLLIMQLETVSMVGGFNQWKAHGRQVRKGEKGLMIWIPTGKGETDQPATEQPESEAKKSGFFAGTVFDVSQTDPIN